MAHAMEKTIENAPITPHPSADSLTTQAQPIRNSCQSQALAIADMQLYIL